VTILSDPEQWEGWFHQHVTPLVDPAYQELSDAVSSALDELRAAEEASEKVHRDRWDVFAPCPIKSAARVRTKLAADGVEGDDDLLERVLALGDLARFRIVATLKRDVVRCRRAFVSHDPKSPESKLFLGRYAIHKLKDFVRDESLRKPLVGHRALQLVVEVPSDGRTVRVEVQVMTQLQHAWDRRNHAMYEWLRENQMCGVEEVDELRVDDHAVAESLHAIDALADHNYASFLRLRGQE
jgi:ppGpp synthetase/RelA/SpoT-type nucleotidyltranferase